MYNYREEKYKSDGNCSKDFTLFLRLEFEINIIALNNIHSHCSAVFKLDHYNGIFEYVHCKTYCEDLHVVFSKKMRYLW